MSGEKTTVQPCVTVGMLVDADNNGIVITHTLGFVEGEDTACCSIAIPQGCIIEAYQLSGTLKPVAPTRKRRQRKCKE